MTAYASFLRRHRPERYTADWRQWGEDPRCHLRLIVGMAAGVALGFAITLAFPQMLVESPIQIPLSGLIALIVFTIAMGWLMYRITRLGRDSDSSDDSEDRDND